MKFTRRRFCQLTLASGFLASLPTSAETPHSLKPEFYLDLWQGRLRAQVFLENLGPEPIEIQTNGHGFGRVKLTARSTKTADEFQLSRAVETIEERRELLSRVGPRPVWTTLESGQKIRVGTYHSQEIDLAQTEELKLSMTVSTRNGETKLPETLTRLTRR